MKLRYTFISLIAIMPFFFSQCTDQETKPSSQLVKFEVDYTWDNNPFLLNKAYVWDKGSRKDTITPTKLIYHINNLSLITADNGKISAKQPYYMFDFEQNTYLPEAIAFSTPADDKQYTVSAVEFTIGIADSATNADMLLGNIFASPMYWGMVQGYINFKFEALSPKVNAIIYHIGGYLAPYKNSRTIKLTFDKPYLLSKENTLTLTADMFKVFNGKHAIDLEVVNLIHAPNDQSVLIADNIAEIFSFKSLK